MHPKLLDILLHKDAPVDQALLEAYLNGRLTDAERQQLEQALMHAGDLENDAIEGWQQAKPQTDMLKHAEAINQKLYRQLHPAAHAQRKKPITALPLIWWLVGLIFILVVLAWVIIRLLISY